MAYDLSPEERYLLERGLVEWGGPAICTEEMARAMGFDSLLEMLDHGFYFVLPALRRSDPMSRLDWARTLLATEIVFASSVMGAGGDWSIITGLTDEATIRLLRDVQRKLVSARRIIGNGLGTRYRTDASP